MIYMDNELIKRLKDAGFPLKPVKYGTNFGDIPVNIYVFPNEKDLEAYQKWKIDGKNDYKDPEAWIEPTLSELINACGDSIILHSLRDKWTAAKGDKHSCGDGWIDSQYQEEAEGSTPEIAVANLYLALNK